MPDGVHTGALGRSLHAMTFGALRTYDEARAIAAANRLQELDHQFQVPIAGEVAGLAAWDRIEVAFAAPLIEALDERLSPYADPLFTFGSVITNGPPALVSCSVRRWRQEDGYYTGAVVDVGVARPGATELEPFKGEVHLNFQGYGAPHSDDGEDEG